MFFIAGAYNKQEQLDFHQSMVCPHCGQYGQYQAYIQYMVFSFFFIPIFKWNGKSFVRSRCCGSVYSMDDELGMRIAKGDNIIIEEHHLTMLQPGHRRLSCPKCGYEIKEEYKYCPNCSMPL